HRSGDPGDDGAGGYQGEDRARRAEAGNTKYRARQHQMLLLYWSPAYMDPHSNADSFARNPDNSDNAKAKPLAWRNAWDIPDIMKETDAAVRERDADKRIGMYQDIQKKMQDDGALLV